MAGGRGGDVAVGHAAKGVPGVDGAGNTSGFRTRPRPRPRGSPRPAVAGGRRSGPGPGPRRRPSSWPRTAATGGRGRRAASGAEARTGSPCQGQEPRGRQATATRRRRRDQQNIGPASPGPSTRRRGRRGPRATERRPHADQAQLPQGPDRHRTAAGLARIRSRSSPGGPPGRSRPGAPERSTGRRPRG